MDEKDVEAVKEFIEAIVYNFENKNKKNCQLGYVSQFKAKKMINIENSQDLINRIK